MWFLKELIDKRIDKYIAKYSFKIAVSAAMSDSSHEYYDINIKQRIDILVQERVNRLVDETIRNALNVARKKLIDDKSLYESIVKNTIALQIHQ